MNYHNETEVESTTDKSKLLIWLRRIGFAGFMFFLIKGLVWLAIFFGIGNLI